jgi:DNA recombination-dependent growth factor C
MTTSAQAVGSANLAKEMMVAAVNDAIAIVALKERDKVLPTEHVRQHVKVRIDYARRELDMLEKALREGA